MTRKSNLTCKPPEEVLRVLNREDTINKAAIALDVAPGTLYRYIRANKLKRQTRVIWTRQP